MRILLICVLIVCLVMKRLVVILLLDCLCLISMSILCFWFVSLVSVVVDCGVWGCWFVNCLIIC